MGTKERQRIRGKTRIRAELAALLGQKVHVHFTAGASAIAVDGVLKKDKILGGFSAHPEIVDGSYCFFHVDDIVLLETPGVNVAAAIHIEKR